MSEEKIGPNSTTAIEDIINNEIGGVIQAANAITTIKPLLKWFIVYCNMQPSLSYPNRNAFFWAKGPNNSINIGNSLKDLLKQMVKDGNGYNLKYNKNIGKIVYPVKIERFFWDKQAAVLDLTLFNHSNEKTIAYGLQIIWHEKQANIFISPNKVIDRSKGDKPIPILPVGYEGGVPTVGFSKNYFKLFLQKTANNGSKVSNTEKNNPLKKTNTPFRF
tara:strand:+ start:219 stop:872 length:654 start_codon:yes stop_codon:yes gene_type:complete